MKKFLLIVFVAVLGGLIALGGANYLGWGDTRYVEVAGTPSSFTNFANAPSTRVVPAPTDGFVVAAERALPAVVHIKASKSVSSGGRMQTPFGDIDPDQLPDAFRDLFGNPGGRGDGGEMPLQQGSGSGVIVSSDGYIVSNNHVVADAETLEVVLNDERTYTAKVIGTDPTTDIALIKIDETDLPTVQFANSDDVKVGEWVVAVGNPFSLTSTVTAGIVSAKGRSIDIVRRSGGDLAIESFIQTDAVVNPGNSGGALVNQNGDLIGINTAISSPTGVFAGYSFAVPSAIVKKVAEDLREFGVVQRGLLGAQIRQLNTPYAKELDIDRNNGVYVAEVMEGSAAQEAGIQSGDVILAVDGVKTLRSSTLLEQLGRRRPGDKVTITVERDGNRRDYEVRLKNSNGTTDVILPEEKPEVYADLGADFENLDEDYAAELNLEGGVAIAELGNGLLSEQTRVRPGFILTKVNGREVTNVEQLERLLDVSRGAVTLEGFYPDDPEKSVKYAIVK
ncbi:Do/DeqQ family serine protease [Neolewinella xylanilytica]|uniref:Do/DeqQ family serine protease n=1 Tax=Neolewinella xylanilytica TaxID=1514080 RepID=A0A2S6I8F8_9BACT|nr:trypsin-like peptidase domain-containing protein [Neolewinella xylanilytica]PPK87780.1 Do/DeqQ family serine protease [Neolewinella xylanilytica]